MESQRRTVLLGILILLLTFGAARSAYSQQAAYGGYAQITGAITTGHCASFASNSQVQDAGAACGTSGANPIYTHTVTESAGAATLVVQSSSVAYTDTDYIALNGNLTATTPAAAGMTDGEILYVDGTTSGTPYTVKFTAGSGVTIGSIVTGVTDPTASTTGCGTTPSTGDIWFAFHWNGSVLTLMGCGIRPPASTIGTSLGGTGGDLSAAASGKYPKSNGATPAVFAASTLAAAGTGTCTNQAVTALNGDAAPTCTTLTSSYLNTSGVTAGSYTSTDLTVDAAGRITAASNGTGGSGTIFCTDNWSPGAISQTFVAGHTYCPNAVGTYTFAAAANVNVNNVTIYCSNKGMVLKRTGTTDGFDISGNFSGVRGCTIDGNSQTAASTGPLISITGNNDFSIDNVFQNTGISTNAITGSITVTNGSNANISFNHFTGTQTDDAIDVQPSGTNTVTAPVLDHNIIDNCTPASGTFDCMLVDVPSGTHVLNPVVTNNNIVCDGSHANCLRLQQSSISPTAMDYGWYVAGNIITAQTALPNQCVKWFSMAYSAFVGNICDDATVGFGHPAFQFGDAYYSTIGNNIGRCLSGFEHCMEVTDFGGLSIVGNRLDGSDNGGYAFILDSAATSPVMGPATVTGNTARPVYSGGGTSGSCFAVGLTGASSTIADVVFDANTCLGTNTTGQIGFTTVAGSGTLSDVTFSNNMMDNLPTGISVGAGTQIDVTPTNHWKAVTTHLSGAAPAISACGTGSPSATGTNFGFSITAGTGTFSSCTATFANSGFATQPVCQAQDLTAKAALGLTYTGGTSIALVPTTGNFGVGDILSVHCDPQ